MKYLYNIPLFSILLSRTAVSWANSRSQLRQHAGNHATDTHKESIRTNEVNLNHVDEEEDSIELCINTRVKNNEGETLLQRSCKVKHWAAHNDQDEGWIAYARSQLEDVITDLQQRPLPYSQTIDDGINANIYLNKVSESSATLRTDIQRKNRILIQYDDDSDDDAIEPYCNCEESSHGHHGPLTLTKIIICVGGALVCTCVAAIIAGCIMGMLSLEPLALMIKMRVGTPEEKSHAEALLPLVQQHHKLLVTLLLVNCICNEALPLFLEKLAPEFLAVLLSVTLVLMFGEIIPSAIFTGPSQLSYAASWAPFVRTLMWFLSPVTYPIVRMLDWAMGHDEESHCHEESLYDRGEIGALVRVIYEAQNNPNHQVTSPMLAAVNELTASPNRGENKRNLHLDEVTMVEGALTMKTKTAKDIYKPISEVFAVKDSTILDEDTIASLYNAGYSRIPIYEGGNEQDDRAKRRIKAIMLSRTLIVVDWDLKRSVKSLPLLKPHCVSPETTLVDLINDFQNLATRSGMAGHIAVVCDNPDLASLSLNLNRAIPDEANVMGIVTMEDVFEALIQEDIIDETDRMEARQMQSARRAVRKWRSFVLENKKKRRIEQERAEWLAARRMRMRPRRSESDGQYSESTMRPKRTSSDVQHDASVRLPRQLHGASLDSSDYHLMT